MSFTKKKCSQNTIIILCWLVYIFAYLGRYSYNANISLIMDDFKINHATAGVVTTCFFFAYGIGQVVNGIFCARYNKKYLFPIVLLLSSVLNLLALVVSFPFFKYMWLINGFLQSFLWSSAVNILGDYLDGEHMKRALVIMGTSATAGTILAYGSSAFFVWLGNYRIMFVFAAVMMLLLGLIWLILFKPGEKQISEETKTEEQQTGGAKSIFALLSVLAFFAIINNLVKDGLNTWVPAILTEEYKMKDEVAIFSSLVLPLLGTFGAFIAIWLNKHIKSFVKLSTVLFTASSVVIIGIMTLGSQSAVMMILCFGIVLCLMHGVNNVVTSIAPLKMRDKMNPGKTAGILNGFCYLGSTISSYGLGMIADNWGWTSVFMLLLVMCVICVGTGIIFKGKTN